MPRSLLDLHPVGLRARGGRAALTAPASWIAPPNSSSFSVSVVLPASGCEMMAKVRRRAISAASGERLWPAPRTFCGRAPGRECSCAAVFTGLGRLLQIQAGIPECRIEAELAPGLLDGELAVVLGDVVDAGRAARDREQRGLGRGIGGQRPRRRPACRTRCPARRAGRSAAPCRRCRACSARRLRAPSRRRWSSRWASLASSGSPSR